MRRTLVQKVGPESVSLQALVPWCSLGNGLMGRRVRCNGEVSYFRYYKRLGAIVKLATSYQVGKENTQTIESKHINLRTRIKRLMRRTLCFSKTEHMHDLVVGLFINRYE